MLSSPEHRKALAEWSDNENVVLETPFGIDVPTTDSPNIARSTAGNAPGKRSPAAIQTRASHSATRVFGRLLHYPPELVTQNRLFRTMKRHFPTLRATWPGSTTRPSRITPI
jgi:hypothetical protein